MNYFIGNNVKDCNKLPRGLTFITDGYANSPEPYSYVFTLNGTNGDNNVDVSDTVQIAFSISNKRIYRRRKTSSAWDSWTFITI